MEKARSQRLKIEVLSHYAGGTPHCMCPGCSEVFLEFLALDHINGGGTAHKRRLGNKGIGNNFYQWIKAEGFPEGYRVLCHNCNWAEAHGGCPHNRPPSKIPDLQKLWRRGGDVHNAKLSDEKIKAIRTELLAGTPLAWIAKEFGVSRSAIGGIAHNKHWKHVPWPQKAFNITEEYYRIGSKNLQAKLSEGVVAQIKRDLIKGANPTALGRKYGVVAQTIRHIAKGRTWKHVNIARVSE